MRLIDADEAYKVLTDYYHQRAEIQHKALKEAFERVPTVDAGPVRHGRWRYIENYIDTYRTIYECSECGSLSNRKDNYCWNCGAKMDEVKDG